MPLYEFRCRSSTCNASFYMEEPRRRVSCPRCGGAARRQPAGAAIVVSFVLEDVRDYCGPISLAKATELVARVDWSGAFEAMAIAFLNQQMSSPHHGQR
jgi:putative FmdB family regulatory protein